MKKLLKVILALLLAVLVVTGIAVGVLALKPELQMKLVTDNTFKNITAFNWQLLLGTDPVDAALTEALGDDMPETRAAVYDFLKAKAADITWEMSSASPENMSAEVTVNYPDGTPIIEAYADELAAYICRGIETGTLSMGDMNELFETVSDTENAAMLSAAAAKPLSDTVSTTVTVGFEKKYGIFYLPAALSEELNAAVSCNLLTGLENLPDMVVDRVVPGIINMVFENIKSSDFENLARLTGMKLENYVAVENYPALSAEIQTFISQRNTMLEYTVGDYDPETGTIPVDCTYCDGSGVVSEFMGAVTNYAFTHLFSNPIPDDAALAQLFSESAANITDYPKLQKTLIFKIDIEAGEIIVPAAVSDVVTANLAATVSKVTTLMGGFEN